MQQCFAWDTADVQADAPQGGVALLQGPWRLPLVQHPAHLRVIAQSLQDHCPGAAQVDKATLHIGAVAFIHRFGSSLNGHVHFHVCVVDGVFEEMPGEGDTDAQSSRRGIVFHSASAIDETAVAQVQADLRRRIPSAPSWAGV